MTTVLAQFCSYHILKWRNSSYWTWAASLFRFLDHTLLHTHTHARKQYDFSDRVIRSSQRSLPARHTVNPRVKHPCSQWDSSSQYQQSACRRLKPYTARLPGSVFSYHRHVNCLLGSVSTDELSITVAHLTNTITHYQKVE